MYHISTTWMQVVPKLNPKGRDLLQVNIHVYYATLQLLRTLHFFIFLSALFCVPTICAIF